MAGGGSCGKPCLLEADEKEEWWRSAKPWGCWQCPVPSSNLTFVFKAMCVGGGEIRGSVSLLSGQACSPSVLLVLFFFFFFFLESEREHTHMELGGREREKESMKQVPRSAQSLTLGLISQP